MRNRCMCTTGYYIPSTSCDTLFCCKNAFGRHVSSLGSAVVEVVQAIAVSMVEANTCVCMRYSSPKPDFGICSPRRADAQKNDLGSVWSIQKKLPEDLPIEAPVLGGIFFVFRSPPPRLRKHQQRHLRFLCLGVVDVCPWLLLTSASFSLCSFCVLGDRLSRSVDPRPRCNPCSGRMRHRLRQRRRGHVLWQLRPVSGR